MADINTNSNQFYYDIQGVQAQRYKAAATGSQDDQQLGQVAAQFEGLFTNMIVKSMREASFGEGLFTNQQSEMFQGMLDQQYAQQIGQSGELGFAKQISTQVRAREGIETPSQPPQGPEASSSAASVSLRAARDYSFMSLASYRPGSQSSDRFMSLAPAGHAPPSTRPSIATTAAASASVDRRAQIDGLFAQLPDINVNSDEKGFKNKQDFVDRVMPHARRAAAKIGTDPKVLVAQAALETGWGKQLPQENERISYNLFGIKTGSSWDGESVQSRSHEYFDGQRKNTADGFRAYSGIGQSFDDYANLITGLSRYKSAIENANDPVQYARELQSAGYATDPNYADKIIQMYNSDEISGYATRVKNLG